MQHTYIYIDIYTSGWQNPLDFIYILIVLCFQEIRDGHQVRPDTQIGNIQGENNKGFIGDGGSSDEMEPPKETLTEVRIIRMIAYRNMV